MSATLYVFKTAQLTSEISNLKRCLHLTEVSLIYIC